MTTPASRQKSKSVFSWTPVIRALRDRSAEVGNEVATLYESLIDDGAHPNPDSVYAGLEVDHHEDLVASSLKMTLLSGGGDHWKLGVTHAYRVGCLAHEIFGLIWPDAFVGQIQDRLRNVRRLGR